LQLQIEKVNKGWETYEEEEEEGCGQGEFHIPAGSDDLDQTLTSQSMCWCMLRDEGFWAPPTWLSYL
jgi:hypothetical protein